MATRREIPTYTSGKSFCKKLVHVLPAQSLAQITVSAGQSGSGTTRVLLNGIDQGDGITNRHANKTLIRSVYLSGELSSVTTPVAANALFGGRLVVVWDKEARGLAPSFGDVFDSTALTAFPRFLYRERFQILYDKVFFPSSDVAWFNSSTQAANLLFRRFLKLKIPVNRMTVWAPSDVSGGSGAGTIANIEKGSLYLLFISPDASTNPSMEFNFEYKLTFEDVE